MPKPTLTVVSEATPHKDGRFRRSERSRQSIILAMLTLIQDGNYDPSAQEVAEEAGVGLRSVFRHFEDMDSLYSDMIVHMEAEILPVAYAPFKSDNWQEQLVELIDRRSEIFERIQNLIISSRIKRYKSPILEHDANRITKAQRNVLQKVLPEDISSEKNLFEALDTLTSFDAFLKLRRDNGLSAKRAKSVIIDAAHRLLGI